MYLPRNVFSNSVQLVYSVEFRYVYLDCQEYGVYGV